MTKIGSLETIRKTTFNFNFNIYKKNLVSHKKNIDVCFLQWFIGVSEVSACFMISERSLLFIINNLEEKTLYFIKSNLGFGKVSKYKNSSRFIVKNQTNIDRLIHIFNGNCILKKTNACFETWLIKRNEFSNLKIVFVKPRKNKICISTNAWLSGVIDACGSFNSILIENPAPGRCRAPGPALRASKPARALEQGSCPQPETKPGESNLARAFFERSCVEPRPAKKCRIFQTYEFSALLRFTLVFKDENNLFLKHCCTFFKGITYNSTDQEVLDTYSMFSHEKLIQYLKTYKLRTLKNVSLKRFEKLLNYIKNKNILPWENKVLKRVGNLIENIK